MTHTTRLSEFIASFSHGDTFSIFLISVIGHIKNTVIEIQKASCRIRHCSGKCAHRISFQHYNKLLRTTRYVYVIYFIIRVNKTCYNDKYYKKCALNIQSHCMVYRFWRWKLRIYQHDVVVVVIDDICDGRFPNKFYMLALDLVLQT